MMIEEIFIVAIRLCCNIHQTILLHILRHCVATESLSHSELAPFGKVRGSN